jgi:hypothetical protein
MKRKHFSDSDSDDLEANTHDLEEMHHISYISDSDSSDSDSDDLEELEELEELESLETEEYNEYVMSWKHINEKKIVKTRRRVLNRYDYDYNIMY